MSTNYLEQLKKKRDQMNHRIQLAEARAKMIDRKRELRRKILVGSYYLRESEKEGQYESLVQAMDTYLKRNSDRRLFDLPELPVDKKT